MAPWNCYFNIGITTKGIAQWHFKEKPKQRLCKIKTSSFLPSYKLNVINNSDVIFMPLVAACIQFKYFSFHYTTGSTLLTFKGPIHKG